MKKILKRDDTLVDFDVDLFKRSLFRAGATDALAEEIAREVYDKIQEGDTTEKIYKAAFDLLNQKETKVAMRYSLKQALFNLGPTGFPFEKFVAEIFARKGYKTRTNVHMQGVCIAHEVDVLATGPERIAMEVKFHNDMRIRSDAKAVLYIKSRFDDLTGKTGRRFVYRKGVVDRCLLVSNTKFTKRAIDYAECAGVELLGWNYPKHKPLPEHIAEVDAHPISCLPSLKKSIRDDLFSMGIVTCKSLAEQKDILKTINNHKEIEREIKMLCVSERRKS